MGLLPCCLFCVVFATNICSSVVFTRFLNKRKRGVSKGLLGVYEMVMVTEVAETLAPLASVTVRVTVFVPAVE